MTLEIEQKKRIIYIAGLGHSGSTILDMSLGAHPKIIGLGEVFAFLKRRDKNTDLKSVCSCGVVGYDCDFWGEVAKIVVKKHSLREQYFALAEFFFEKYGNDTILVDSSKNSYSLLKDIAKKYDLRVIYLTRDFRSWAYSRAMSASKSVFFMMFKWLFENLKLLYVFKKMDLNIFNVGYEEFALYPEFILKKICDFAEIDFDEQMLNPDKTKSHIIAGNVVRADKRKRAKIVYDARWFTSAGIFFASLPFVIFNRFNKKKVYSNVLSKNLDAKEFLIFDKKNRKEIEKKIN